VRSETFSACDHRAIDFLEFTLAALPHGQARVLEIGCGRGELAAALAAAGHEVVAIDPEAPAGPLFVRVKLEDFRSETRFDAAVASLALHHVAELDAAVERIAGLLEPAGRLVLDEFAWERCDDRAASWLGEPLSEWREEHADLHTGAALLHALERRFDRIHLEWIPYLARMEGDVEAEADEARAIAEGALDPIGFRWVGRRA
jgi:2-polyprenyl-3-methyl-5-hydroxy-6-metoxy-1,4-benzoquinol methylase